MNAENYAFYKSQGICTCCRKAKAIPGRTRCLDCRMEQRIYESKRKKKSDSKKDMERYNEAKANGICVRCKKRKAEHGLKCNRCYTAVLRKKKSIRIGVPRSELPNYGICYSCCKNEILPGRKVCGACYEKRLASVSKIMHMTKTEKNSFGEYAVGVI